LNRRKVIAGVAGAALLAAGGSGATAATTADTHDSVTVKQSYSLKMVPNRYFQSNMRWNRDTYTVQTGGKLTLLFNKDQEGPHTLSVVKARDLPDNAREANNCKACNAIGEAHGADPNSDAPPKFPFVENGKGQKKPASFDRPGDSMLTGPKRGSKVTVDVTAPAGRTLSFLCAIHTQMQAKLKVVK
jgi:hypothetical protein